MSDVAPWQAVPLTEECKAEHFSKSLTYHAETQKMCRSARRAGWMVGAVGTAVGATGLVYAAVAIPKTHERLAFVLVDRTTGYVGPPVSEADAPKLFGEAVAKHYVREYVEARESYVWQTDELAFHKVTVMSAPDEQIRYAAAHSQANPLSPLKVYGRNGFVSVGNFHIERYGTGKEETLVYIAKFDRIVVAGGQQAPAQQWFAEIQFEWRPTLPMRQQDRLINEAGFQVVSYSSRSEAAQ